MHPVIEFDTSLMRKDAIVLDRYCATSISCPKIAPSLEKFSRVPDFIVTVSLSQTQAQFAELPSTDARASSLALSVPVRWFERTYIKTERLLASRVLLLRIARIRRAPGYFFVLCLLPFEVRAILHSLVSSAKCERRSSVRAMNSWTT